MTLRLLHACMCVGVHQFNDGRGRGKFIFALLRVFFFFFLLPKFKKVSHRRLLGSSLEHAALVFLVAA